MANPSFPSESFPTADASTPSADDGFVVVCEGPTVTDARITMATEALVELIGANGEELAKAVTDSFVKRAPGGCALAESVADYLERFVVVMSQLHDSALIGCPSAAVDDQMAVVETSVEALVEVLFEAPVEAPLSIVVPPAPVECPPTPAQLAALKRAAKREGFRRMILAAIAMQDAMKAVPAEDAFGHLTLLDRVAMNFVKGVSGDQVYPTIVGNRGNLTFDPLKTSAEVTERLYELVPELRGLPDYEGHTISIACGLTGAILRNGEIGESQDVDMFISRKPNAAPTSNPTQLAIGYAFEIHTKLNENAAALDRPAYRMSRSGYTVTFARDHPNAPRQKPKETLAAYQKRYQQYARAEREAVADGYYRPIQIILRVYPSAATVVADFDFGCCQVLVTTKGLVYLTPAAVLTFTTGIVMLAMTTVRLSTNTRIQKQLYRGYSLCLVGCPERLFDHPRGFRCPNANAEFNAIADLADNLRVMSVKSIRWISDGSKYSHYGSFSLDYCYPRKMAETYVRGLRDHGKTRLVTCVSGSLHPSRHYQLCQPTTTWLHEAYWNAYQKAHDSPKMMAAIFPEWLGEGQSRRAVKIALMWHIEQNPVPFVVKGYGENTFSCIEMDEEKYYEGATAI